MIFHSPSWLPPVTQDLSKIGTVGDFVLRGQLNAGSKPVADDSVLVAADASKSRNIQQLADDVEALAAGLAYDLQWSPNEPAQGEKVIAVLSENSVDFLTYCWATHRLRGTCLLLHASTAPAENAQHMKHAGCSTLIMSPALADSGRAVAAIIGDIRLRLYLTTATPVSTNGEANHHPRDQDSPKTIEELMKFGSSLNPLPPLDWSPEEAQSSIAYLCATSGTSGAQKLARLTHHGIITNIVQLMALENMTRDQDMKVTLGILPFSHVQGVVSSHSSIYIRDRLVLHATFDMQAALESVQTHRINRLYLVPSVLAALISNPFLFKVFDLSSVDEIYVGASILSVDLYAQVKAVQPNWNIVVGYGLTESSVAVAMSSPHEYLQGSVGILLPQYQARLLREDGSEVEGFDEPGELLLSSPNQADGYLGDDEASAMTFRDGWLYTGDVAVFRKSPKGDSHLSIVDRLRDMIKVKPYKGIQVSPVAIENCLKQHPSVADAAVIGVPDYLAGERAKAFISLAKKPAQGSESDELENLFERLDEHVQSNLTEPHWLRGRYELLEALPRTPSGKIAKGLLRARSP
ncbi:putative AMP dependent ligase/synthetase [Mariannaea sp. PMI_226]|nr:putative AMP dependent ligase/synthetase [Mariannaea sp. PMI_226]